MGDITISGSPRQIQQPQSTGIPAAPAAPPQPPPKAEPAPAESTRLSAETSGAVSEGQKSPESASHFAQAFGSAAMKALGITGEGGLGEKVHHLKEKVGKETARAEKYKDGVPEKDMEKLRNAAQGGPFKKAAAAAMMGTDIKGLPDAIKRTEQWNGLPQGARDTAVTGLRIGDKVLGAIDGVVHPD